MNHDHLPYPVYETALPTLSLFFVSSLSSSLARRGTNETRGGYDGEGRTKRGIVEMHWKHEVLGGGGDNKQNC